MVGITINNKVTMKIKNKVMMDNKITMTLSRALWKTPPSYKHNNWNYNLQYRRVFAIQYYLDKKVISIMR
jgi:hypothetical protein